MKAPVKFSIIVPVYNVEDFLEKCINSILEQTYPHFELLLINDGSTDKSGTICDTFFLVDSRVQVYHKKNGGVSSARNLGLDRATGNYVTFVDSDDFLGKDSLESMYTCILSEELDIIEFPCFYNFGNLLKEKISKSNYQFIKYYGKNTIINYWFYNPRFEACTRFYRRNQIGNLRFDENLTVGEDTLFFFQLLVVSTSYGVISEGMYYYRFRNDSVMNSLPRSAILEHDKLLLTSIFNTFSYDTQLLCNFLYRVAMSKLTTQSMIDDYSLSFAYLDTFLQKIKFDKVVLANSPMKVKLVILLLKIINAANCLRIIRLFK